MEAAQLIGATTWLRKNRGTDRVFLETSGIRSQVMALIAAALEPNLFYEVLIRDGMESLSHLLDKPIPYQEAPELFCPDLYREFDIESLAMLTAPTEVAHA
jgi:hypothetical protein